MAIEPVLLNLAVSSITSAAGAFSRAVTAVSEPLVSPFAALLQTESQAGGTLQPQPVKIEDLQSRAKALQENVEQRLSKLIADSKVQLGDQVRIRVSELDGTLEADSVASPQRQILEAALASDPTLASDFSALVAMRKILSATKNNGPLVYDRGEDTIQALADFASQAGGRFEAVLRFSPTDTSAQLEFE